MCGEQLGLGIISGVLLLASSLRPIGGEGAWARGHWLCPEGRSAGQGPGGGLQSQPLGLQPLDPPPG